MKALVLKEYNEFSIVEMPVPECGPNDALVRVKACAICGSDVHGMDGSTGRRIPPIVMGHEASGVIERVGAGVKGFSPGDRVTFDSTVFCGSCFFCRRGEFNLCDSRMVLGVSCGEYRLHGAMAEYVAVPERILFGIPEPVTFEQAAMVEPLSVALHAVRQVPVALNCSVAVMGAGMIGLLVIQLLKAAGCGEIIAVDMVDEKLSLARTFGATHACRSDRVDVAAAVREATGGRGADIAFEVVGIAPTLRLAIDSVRKGGTVALVGNLSPSAEFPLQSVVTRQIRLQGSCASAGEYADCLDLIAGGKADVDSFISAVAPLSEGGSYFRRLREKEKGLLKVILQP